MCHLEPDPFTRWGNLGCARWGNRTLLEFFSPPGFHWVTVVELGWAEPLGFPRAIFGVKWSWKAHWMRPGGQWGKTEMITNRDWPVTEMTDSTGPTLKWQWPGDSHTSSSLCQDEDKLRTMKSPTDHQWTELTPYPRTGLPPVLCWSAFWGLKLWGRFPSACLPPSFHEGLLHFQFCWNQKTGGPLQGFLLLPCLSERWL